ncbi:MAG: YggS family pyridoxal phosphate-dependent enzyme [Oscillospiraceae bacterium]|jgi:pyridoxal phosphate enzyme (YggS family)|nr:MAG: YggS family pyridoxal phosphate-dependent enzyme [Oscillospiraceae bacterium]
MEKFIPDPARLQAVEENWKRVLERVQEGAVKSGRDPREVRLMAVTKTVEPVYINRALDLGADLIGENRVQEYLGKRDELHLDGVEKHLIGRLQTNKVKYIVGQVDMIQSVDSMKLAQEISKQSVKHGVTTRVLVEVNIGREESKSGIMIEALPELLEEAAQLPGLQIKGLMCIPPICETETQVRKYFETMHQSFIDIKDKKHHNIDMDILSMGMSGDFEAAIAEGSTLVRVGSAIFGARQYR